MPEEKESCRKGQITASAGADAHARPIRTPTSRAASGCARQRATARSWSACRSCSAAQYFCQPEDAQLFDLAEPIPGPSTEALAKVAREAGVVVIGSLFERRAAGIYHNTAVIDAEGGPGRLPQDAHPRRSALLREVLFHAGRSGVSAFDTAVGRIGTLVCWDQWYPEGARLTALAGADVLFYPTAIGWHPDEKAEFGAAQAAAWQTIQRAHAIANGVYVAAVNRVGLENGDILRQSRAWAGDRVLGRQLRRRSVRRRAGRGLATTGRDPDRRRRPQAPGERAATGRSCATAASTPRRRHPAFLDEREPHEGAQGNGS